MEYLPADQHVNYITPVSDVFTVGHFGVPKIGLEGWTISVGGLVTRQLELTMTDLLSLPQRDVTAFHECAGNPVYPRIPQRRIANIKWTGVPLATLLGKTGVHEEARYVLTRGADCGTWQRMQHPAYEKDLPLAKAQDPSVLLAIAMNDTPIPVGHGGPVRLIVPGYYGTNSTKWLREISLSAVRSTGAFTTKYYTDRETTAGTTREIPVWGVAPNSILVGPSGRQPVNRSPVEIWGWCWAEHPIARLDISTDDGQSWTRARLAPRRDHSWQRFTLPWRPPAAGEYCIVSRATDEQGNRQPDSARRNRVYKRIIHVQLGSSH